MKNNLKVALSLSLITGSLSLNAALQSFDSRSHAMGGIGVSSADYLTASFHNPALVSRYGEDDDVGLLLPSIGAQIYDEDDLIDNLDDFDDIVDQFEADRNLDNMNTLIDALAEMQDDRAFVQVGANIALAIPSKYISTSFAAKAYADAMVVADIEDSDLDPDNYLIPDNPHEFTSRGMAMGVGILDLSISLSKRFETEKGTWFIGVTPKYQEVHTYNYIVSVDNYDFDDLDNDRYSNDDSNFNFDLGLAYEFNNGIVLGVSARNIISDEYETEVIDGIQGEYEVNPVYTIGASYNHALFTFGVDVDLNENEHYKDLYGLRNAVVDTDNDNTQMLGVGVEFNAWDWAQLRGGYQHDIADTLDDQVTAGIGISPFGAVHLDASLSYAGDEQFGAVVQTYFTF